MDWVCHKKKQPFILSFQAFSCEELLSIFKWQSESTLAYGIWNPPTSLNLKLPAGSAKVLPALLEGVLAEHTPLGFELDGRRSEAESWKQCLAAMENAGLVKKTHEDKRFSQWCLQEEGARVIKAGYRVKCPQQALQIRSGAELTDRSPWELISLLDKDGWTHMVKARGKHDATYVPGSTPKVWYSSPGSQSLSRWYLIALLSGEHNVVHWQPAQFYQALVEGKAPPARGVRRSALAVCNVDAEDWDLPAALPDVARRPARRGTKRNREALLIDPQMRRFLLKKMILRGLQIFLRSTKSLRQVLRKVLNMRIGRSLM